VLRNAESSEDSSKMTSNETKNTALNILIVDDELSIRKTLGICLESEGHHISATVSNAADALIAVSEKPIDLAFVDIRIGNDSGLSLLPKLLDVNPKLKVIILTAYASIDSTVEAMRRGAFDYIPKPFNTAQLLSAVNKVEEICHLEGRLKGLQEQI
jgi:two-component system, NtrC family, response regulator AlgB